MSLGLATKGVISYGGGGGAGETVEHITGGIIEVAVAIDDVSLSFDDSDLALAISMPDEPAVAIAVDDASLTVDTQEVEIAISVVSDSVAEPLADYVDDIQIRQYFLTTIGYGDLLGGFWIY